MEWMYIHFVSIIRMALSLLKTESSQDKKKSRKIFENIFLFKGKRKGGEGEGKKKKDGANNLKCYFIKAIPLPYSCLLRLRGSAF